MSRRILLADDSVTIQKVIELTFMDEDFEVRAVSNGDEALAVLPDLRPDFVIADVHMPGANGYEVCRRSKQLLPSVPVLLLVGTFEPFDEPQARSAGADSFLKKPFDSQELLQRVQDLLASSAPAPISAPVALPTAAPAGFGAATAFPPGPTAVPAPPFVAPEPSFELPSLGPEFSESTSDFAAPSALRAEEPVWGSLDIEAPALSSPFADIAGISDITDEPPLTLMDDQPFALEEDRPPLAFEDDRAFTLEDDASLSLDEPLTFREEEAAEVSFSYDQPQDRFLEEIERPVRVEAPAPPEPEFSWASDEERLGVPIGAAPLVDSLHETEERIDSAPSYQTGQHSQYGGTAPHEPASPVAAGTESYVPQVPASAPLQVGYTESYGGNGSPALTDSDIDRIARRIVELLGDKVVRDIAWEVIPDLAEVVIKDRLRELESQV
jgi:CheY-like chemotaxis protein